MKTDLDCPQVLSLLKSDYLDNELEPAVKVRVDRHIELCAKCRSVKEKLAALAVPLRSAARATPPPDLWPRIQAELNRQHVRSVRPQSVFQANVLEYFLMRPSFAAAAAAILILISAAFYLQTQRPVGAESAPDLGALTGNIEIHEPSMGFGSNIEQFFL